jgi:PAS domain S-box-containing protein
MLVQSFNQMTKDLQLNRGELEQRKKYMEIVLKNVGAGVISIDEKGRITTINTSAEQILGIKGEEILGKKFSDVFPGGNVERAEALLSELKSSGKDSIEKQLTTNVTGKSLLINLTALKDEEGRSLGVVTVFHDLTQLMKAQRMAAWREVARRIAHEIKNPFRLFKGKRSLFTEDIAKLCEPFLGHLRNHLSRYKIDIVRPIPSEFPGNSMGSQEGRDDIDGMALVQGFHHPKNFHFTLERSPYPLFASTVVTPLGSIRSNLLLPRERSSSKEERRVASTVERIPPPLPAIS